MSKAKAKIIHIKGVTFMGITDSKHWVPMDGPENFNGSDAGIRPKEMLLLSLSGCSAADVASILTKMREPFTKFEIEVEANMTEEHPKVYSKINLVYKFWGEGLNPKNIDKAIYLSQTKYCGVTSMLKDSIEIVHSYVINP